jgi:CRISPR-associated exonuclease Cas4
MTSLVFGLVFLAAAFILLLISGRQRRRAGLPGGRVIYTDTHAWGAVAKPLFDPTLGLTGKPDYLVEQNGKFIPVEVKTGRTPEAPYDSHIYQVAVYCLLVQKTYGKRPSHGIIHYSNRDFAVDYTPELESALLDLLSDMRRDEHRSNVGRSHEDEQRCRRCGYHDICDERLV